MLLIHCPYCEEERPELEFRHGGEAHIARPSGIADISDDDFEKFFFIRENRKGVVAERWRHIHGCGRFFNAIRDSISDRFAATYKAGEPRPVLPAVPDSGRAAWSNIEPAELNVKKPARRKAKSAEVGEE